MIQLNNISKTYHKSDQVLSALTTVNLTIKQGDIVGIIGPSGAGKSTLLRTMNLLERPDSGEVIIDGVNLCALHENELATQRQSIGMIFQHFNLVKNINVFDNVALPLRLEGYADINKRVDELLAVVGLSDKAHNFPAELSGGQKQRVAIARSLTTKPKVLLCDEATSALDPDTTNDILRLLKKINTEFGITIVIVSHEMSVICKLCHSVVLLDKGTICSYETLSTLLNNHQQGHLLIDHLCPALPDYLAKQLQKTRQSEGKPLLQIRFYGDSAKSPIISQLSRKLGVDMNILQANIDEIAGKTLGILTVQLNTDKALTNKTIQALTDSGLYVEVIGYVN